MIDSDSTHYRRTVGLGIGLLMSLGLNVFLMWHQRGLQAERDVAVLRQDSTLASKLELDRELQRMRTDLEALRKRTQELVPNPK